MNITSDLLCKDQTKNTFYTLACLLLIVLFTLENTGLAAKSNTKRESCSEALETRLERHIRDQLSQAEPLGEEKNRELFFGANNQLNDLWAQIFPRVPSKQSKLHKLLVKKIAKLVDIQNTEGDWNLTKVFNDKYSFFSYHLFTLNQLHSIDKKRSVGTYSEIEPIVRNHLSNFNDLPLILKYRIFEFATFILESNQSFKEEQALFAKGTEIYLKFHHTMSETNLRLLFHYVSKRYHRGRRNITDQTEIFDLFQDAYIGGMNRGIELYNPEKGTLLNAVIPQIQQYVGRNGVNNARLIRLPARTNDILHRFLRLLEMKGIEKSEQRFSEETINEVAAELKINTDKLKELLEIRAMTPVFLDGPSYLNEPDSSMQERIADKDTIDIDSSLSSVLTTSKISARIIQIVKNICALKPRFARDWEIFLQYSQLQVINDQITESPILNNQTPSLQSVGDQYGISRERVRQIIAKVQKVITKKYVELYDEESIQDIE